MRYCQGKVKSTDQDTWASATLQECYVDIEYVKEILPFSIKIPQKCDSFSDAPVNGVSICSLVIF